MTHSIMISGIDPVSKTRVTFFVALGRRKVDPDERDARCCGHANVNVCDNGTLASAGWILAGWMLGYNYLSLVGKVGAVTTVQI